MKRYLSIAGIAFVLLCVNFFSPGCGGSTGSGGSTDGGGSTGSDAGDGAAAAEVTVNSMSKTSVASTGSGNAVTLTFTLAEAAPDGVGAPTVAVTDAGGSALAVSGCAFGSDRTTYSCAVSGVAGCTTFSDYSVAVTGSDWGEGYTDVFNSADDEFDNSSSLETCWRSGDEDESDGTADIADGALHYSLTGPDGHLLYSKSIASVADFAVLTSIPSVERPTGGDGFLKPQIDVGFSSNAPGNLLYFAVIANHWDVQLPPPATGVVLGTPSFYSSIGNDPPFYACFVRSGDVIKIYLGSALMGYTQITSSNTEGGDMNDLEEAGGSWAENFLLAGYNGYDGQTIAGDYDYVRFKTAGITGASSDDCPEF